MKVKSHPYHFFLTGEVLIEVARPPGFCLGVGGDVTDGYDLEI